MIDSALQGKTWVFNCNEWLDKSTGDGSLERELTPSSDETVEYESKVPYEVVVRTSDIKGAGTDARGETHTHADVHTRRCTDRQTQTDRQIDTLTRVAAVAASLLQCLWMFMGGQRRERTRATTTISQLSAGCLKGAAKTGLSSASPFHWHVRG